MVIEQCGGGGGVGEEENGGDVALPGDDGRPWLHEVVDNEVRGEVVEEVAESGLGSVEGGFEGGHEVVREVFGGVKVWGEEVGKMEFNGFYEGGGHGWG